MLVIKTLVFGLLSSKRATIDLFTKCGPCLVLRKYVVQHVV